jgi:hypothetical protein
MKMSRRPQQEPNCGNTRLKGAVDTIVYSLARASFTVKFKAFNRWEFSRVTNAAEKLSEKFVDRF